MGEPDDMLANVMDSFKAMTAGNTVALPSKDSTNIDLHREIRDCVYGLLSQESLTAEQVTLLGLLLRYVNESD